MVVFFSTAISVLYYLGVMQVAIRLVAVVMQKAMGTTAAESLNAAGNIFIGMVCIFGLSLIFTISASLQWFVYNTIQCNSKQYNDI